MKHFLVIVFLIIQTALLTIIEAETTINLNGLSASDKSVYQKLTSNGEYNCKDKSLTIPISYINDDYCDCPDGSDEPGTSACIGSQFFCQNKGSQSKTLFSSQVNDGVCDCCDGSDEWQKRVDCQNSCSVEGAEFRRHMREKYEKIKKGIEIKNQLKAESAELKKAQKEQIENLRNEVASIEEKYEATKLLKEEKEKIEEEQRNQKQAEWDAQEDARIAALEAELKAKEQQQQQQQGETPQQGEQGEQQQGEQKVEHENKLEVTKLEKQTEKTEEKEKESSDLKNEKSDVVMIGVGQAGESSVLSKSEAEIAQKEMKESKKMPPLKIPPGSLCIGWRQTGGCKGNGPREEAFDKDCNALIRKGSSGYCECAEGVKVEYECDHKNFKCKDICVTHFEQLKSRYCVGWKQTGGCSPSGPRESQFDKDCETLIKRGSSGYCECVNDVKVEFSCDHKSLRCKDHCVVAGSVQEQKSVEVTKEKTDVLKMLDSDDNTDDDSNDSDETQQFVDSDETTENILQKNPMPEFKLDEAEDLRREFNTIESRKKDLQNTLTSLLIKESHNYGEDDAFLALVDKCAEIEINKFKYSICLYGEAKQHDGHNWIKLGSFSGWDKDTPKRMVFEKGQRCYNGPDRSAMVDFECGSEFKITSGNEVERCVYHFTAEVPAICDNLRAEMIQKEIESLE